VDTVNLAVIQSIYTIEQPGPWCVNHRSVYCADVIELLSNRGDQEGLHAALTEGNSGIIQIAVPIFPEFSVWEHLEYAVHLSAGPIGAYAMLEEPRPTGPYIAVNRLMVGESAQDLGASLRQGFEDDLEEHVEKLVRPKNGNFPYSCKSKSHSFRYNNIAAKVTAPNLLHKVLVEGVGDRDLTYAMLYCFIRHARCLFCYVNDENRNAVRVNPSMAGFFDNDSASDSSYDDLVP
jgi:hypothetical protein